MSVHHDHVIEATLQALEPGCPVYSADNEQVGTLREVKHQHIKIDAPFRRDFWIKGDFVVMREPGRIELSFIKDDLGAYRLDRPEADDPMTGQEVDAALTADEQMEQRVRMERELAQQRQQLPHMHPEGEQEPPDTFGTFGEPVESELARLDELTGDNRASAPPPAPPSRTVDGRSRAPSRTFDERTGTYSMRASEIGAGTKPGVTADSQNYAGARSHSGEHRHGNRLVWMVPLGLGLLGAGAVVLMRRRNKKRRLPHLRVPPAVHLPS